MDRIVTERLTPFVKARNHSRLAFLVGAGISKDPPAGRALARELLCALANGLWEKSTLAKRRWKKETICGRIRKIRFENMMQIVADTTGSVSFLRVLKGGRPNALHRALAHALGDGCPILTTNLDLLIERAPGFPSEAAVLKTSANFKAWGRRSERFVLAKLHGSLDDLSSICATMRQVGHLGPAFMWDPSRGEYLARVRKRFPMAIVGYSGADDADVVPRLAIAESSKPLLWCFHSDCPIRLATNKEAQKLALSEEVAAFLEKESATVLIGDTRSLLYSLDGRNEPTRRAMKAESIAVITSRLLRYMGRTTAPLFADYLIGRIMYEAGFKATSRSHFSRIRRTDAGRHPGLVCRCIVNEATVDSELGNREEAGKKLDGVLTDLFRWVDERTFLDALLNRALIHRYTGRLDIAEKMLRSHLYALHGNRRHMREWARAAIDLADLLLEQARVEEAEDLMKTARTAYRDAGDQSGLANVYSVGGKILFSQGQKQEALTAMSMALWHARIAWDKICEATILCHMGTIQRSIGMLDAASDSFSRALTIAISQRDSESISIAQLGLVAVALMEGRLDEAVRISSESLPEAERLGLERLATQTRGNLGLALSESKRCREALEQFEPVISVLVRTGPRDLVAFTHQNIAECLAGLGRLEEAEQSFDHAIREYEKLGLREKAAAAKALRKRIFENV